LWIPAQVLGVKMRASYRLWKIALTLGSLSAGATASGPDMPLSCPSALYSGVDSRLEISAAARIPGQSLPVLGFEVLGGGAIVAYKDRLLAITKKDGIPVAIPDLKGISFTKDGQLFVQSNRGVGRFGDGGIEYDKPLTADVHGRLFGSGNGVLMEARERDKTVQFVARNARKRLVVANFEGPLRASSWNQYGLAAILGNSLFVWQPGSQAAIRLISDSGLTTARDVCLIGPKAAVVTLHRGVVLITPEGISVVIGGVRARCRYVGKTLYLLIEDNGEILAVKGLEQLGTKRGDHDHAVKLLLAAPKQNLSSSLQFREAVRIVGCDEARRILSDQPLFNTDEAATSLEDAAKAVKNSRPASDSSPQPSRGPNGLPIPQSAPTPAPNQTTVPPS